MKKILSVLSVVVLFVLCGCSKDGISDTYWRNDQTGDWLIGFTENKVVYDSRIWDIMSQTEKEGTYSIQAANGTDKLDISIGSAKENKRVISIGNEKNECSLIEGRYLPDYPQKDTISAFANSNYHEGDNVTIMGWIKPMPAAINWLKNKIGKDPGSEKEVAVHMMTYVLNDEEPAFTVPIDSLGHFTLQMPIENTTSFSLECGGWWLTFVAEPNDTCFLMIDPLHDKRLFMGKNARIQNEINAHKFYTTSYGIKKLEEIGDIKNILDTITNHTKAKLQELEDVCREHPTLSERFRTYQRNYILVNNAYYLMQGMYIAPNYELPEEYCKVVDEQYWKQLAEPYTLEAYTFSHFFNDYSMNMENQARSKIDYKLKWIMDLAEKDGIIRLSAEDREAIKQFDLEEPKHREKVKNVPDSLRKVLDEEFEKNDFMKVVNEITSREGYQEYAIRKFTMRDLEYDMKEMDAQGWSETAQDLFLGRYMCQRLKGERKPLDKYVLDYADKHIHMPAALNAVHAMNDNYEQIGKRKLKYGENLMKNDEVKDMSDGEKILRKLIEPHKGKIILVDVWGTWCGPCKQNLSHFQEEYERLKDFDLVYLFLANRSSDESWKNVIKEYHVEGYNVVHYNLPAEQQKAVENYIGVTGYPTYKLIDRDGTLLNVNAYPEPIEQFAKLLERM